MITLVLYRRGKSRQHKNLGLHRKGACSNVRCLAFERKLEQIVN